MDEKTLILWKLKKHCIALEEYFYSQGYSTNDHDSI